MDYLKSKEDIKVKRFEGGGYIVFIKNHYSFISPKLLYKYDIEGNLKFTKSQGILKSIFIMFLIWSSVVTCLFVCESIFYGFRFLLPIYLGILGFAILLNLFTIEVTNRKVENQILQNRENLRVISSN